jgi:hypothetical protein
MARECAEQGAFISWHGEHNFPTSLSSVLNFPHKLISWPDIFSFYSQIFTQSLIRITLLHWSMLIGRLLAHLKTVLQLQSLTSKQNKIYLEGVLFYDNLIEKLIVTHSRNSKLSCYEILILSKTYLSIHPSTLFYPNLSYPTSIPSIYLSFYLSVNIYQSFYLSINLSIYLLICLSICLSVYLSIYPVAPTWSMGHPWNALCHFSFLLLDSR